jgi:hypothetical protein
MIDGPHILGFSPVALFIILITAFASKRRAGSRASTNAATLASVALVLFTVMRHS